jgi:pyruvate-formate lyase-activating enzyme
MQDVAPTPLHTLKEAERIAMEEGLRYVYLGNV